MFFRNFQLSLLLFQPISLGLLTEDAQNFVCMASGYYKIFVDRDKRIVETTQGKNTSDPDGNTL